METVLHYNAVCLNLLMRSSIAFALDFPSPPAPHWIITRVHPLNHQICENVFSLTLNKFDGPSPSTFHKGPKGPPGFPCPAPWPIYWSERRGRDGEMVIEEAQVQSMGGDHRTNVP